MKNIAMFALIAFSLSINTFSNEIDPELNIESPAISEDIKKEITKISEAFGHLMGKNLESIGVKFDIQYVIKGLQDAAEGKASPMTELECIQAITLAQESSFKEQSSKNLSLAENFLEKNRSLEGVVSLEDGKVQYKIDKEGTGDALSPNSSPLIRYKGTFLNGTVFGSSIEDEPISLEEVIPGLKTGFTGIKEGEKRTIYIHPDCAYGTKGSLPPNSLLTFEIEVVKAVAPLTEDLLTDTTSKDKELHSEIATPETLPEQIR